MNMQIRYLELNDIINGRESLSYAYNWWSLDNRTDGEVLRDVYCGYRTSRDVGLSIKSWANGYHNDYYLVAVF